MDWVPIVLLTFKLLVLGTGMFFAIKWHYDQDRKTSDEGTGGETRAELRLFVTMIIALLLSLVGIVYAGCWGNPAEGGRGGALGCALTLLMAFMSKPNAQAGHTPGDVLAEPEPATLGASLDQLARLTIETERLRAALASARRDTIYLGVAGALSTFAWKFGDVAAAWFNFGH